MDGHSKRKAPGQSVPDGDFKRRKSGKQGKWKVPRSRPGKMQIVDSIQPGDQGIWISCPRGMKGKAVGEVHGLFEEYVDKLYGIKSQVGDVDKDGDEGTKDIADSIQRELDSLKPAKDQNHGLPYAEVRLKDESVLFFRTQVPLEPIDFVERICQDIKARGEAEKMPRTRYLNRLTPITHSGKAFEKDLETIARSALRGVFKLKPQQHATNSEAVLEAVISNGRDEAQDEPVQDTTIEPCSYAIRVRIRNHNTLERKQIIDSVATFIDSQHEVDLSNPDKVIMIDVYMTICGMSVLPRSWDSLRKYNLFELQHPNKDKVTEKAQSRDSGNSQAPAADPGDFAV